MKNAWMKAAGLSLFMALGACMHNAEETPPAEAVERVQLPAEAPADGVAASEPRPDAPCGPAQVTLYFGEQVASDEPVVTPLLNDFIDRIRRCEATGNTLRSITIAATADPGQGTTESRAQVRRRIDRVRAALVNVGAPADKIAAGGAEPASPVMGRRADITAHFN